ncbi:MAG TPA: hypothetical protein VFU37_03135, partial [Pyrinomonadaceae bacterium]|nr:hypothetical protein [Pyrinomonadaceae bacterium]
MQLRPSRLTGALVLFALFFSLVTQAAPPQPDDQPLLGFDRESTAAQRALEARFDATLNPADLRAWLKRLSAHPHHIGSPYGKQNAEFIASQFRSWGFDTQIEEFNVLFPTPKTRLV